jgi:hypothetical protein
MGHMEAFQNREGAKLLCIDHSSRGREPISTTLRQGQGAPQFWLATHQAELPLGSGGNSG